MIRISFDEISVKGTRRWTDENGRKRQQTKKFYQTVNPFNIGADGLPKTREQISIEVTAERDVWLKQSALTKGSVCNACGKEFGDFRYHTAASGDFCSHACYNMLFTELEQDTK